jgi:GT2 family glycosyltransferase/glycosyltransferase involved in cell wall biosynthesis
VCLVAGRSQAAVDLYNKGQYEEAKRLIAVALSECPTSELWNDWGVVQLALGDREAAEKGFRRALEFDEANTVTAVNLGVLLVALGRFAEAAPWLERARRELPEPDCSLVAAILEECHRQRDEQRVVPHAVSDAPVTRPPLSILVVHEMLPQPDRGGSDVRVVQVLREARAQGHQVTYVARNGTLREQYGPALQDLGIALWTHDAERLSFLGIDAPSAWRFEKLLRHSRFDLAILFHWFWNGTSVPEHYMEEIRRLSPTTRIVVVSEDQHGLRELRMAQLSGLWSDYERTRDYTDRELEVYRRADLVRVIAEEDRRGLLSRAPELNIEVLPMIADILPLGPGFTERSDLLFVGNFDNLANRDGVEWMLAEVWPRVRRQLPETVLTLAGNNLPPDLGFGHDGIHRVGHVPDLEPLFAQHRVFVSPVRFGTGIKTKNLAALTHGLPLVTSAGGAEGLNLVNGTHALIADTPEDFAEAIVRAYTDECLWQKLSREGQRLIADEFGPKRLQEAVRKLIQQARAVVPKPYDPSYVWSYLLVEKRHPEVLTHKPARHRNLLRLVGYVSMAEELLAQGRPAQALEQLRHIFSVVRGQVSASALFLHVLALMARCYREIGDDRKAGEYGRAVKAFAGASDPTLPRPPARSHATRTKPSKMRLELSVIIPTHNRERTLAACLANLAAQSLPADRWEAIVVDDGSVDGTAQVCRSLPGFYRLEHLHQQNAGAGAARRLAVERARGDYLLLVNDDTMAAPDLLAEHLRVQYEHRREKIAVLGNFVYPSEARERALTYFLSANPFLFPQVSLDPGIHSKNAYFIACNLSVRRDAVLGVGSFDSRFRVAEDTELGVRLRAAGYHVLYHPKALAVHDHLEMTIGDLVRRARVYGRTQLLLFRKHPQLLGEGTGPFGGLDETAAQNMRSYLDERREQVSEAVRTLEKLDTLNLSRFFPTSAGERSAADDIMGMVARIVPEVFWFFLAQGFLEARESESRSCSEATGKDVGQPGPESESKKLAGVTGE